MSGISWISPSGVPVPVDGVDEAHLQALYTAEETQRGFTEAYDAASPRTRHAWHHGYTNPRTTKVEGTSS